MEMFVLCVSGFLEWIIYFLLITITNAWNHEFGSEASGYITFELESVKHKNVWNLHKSPKEPKNFKCLLWFFFWNFTLGYFVEGYLIFFLPNKKSQAKFHTLLLGQID